MFLALILLFTKSTAPYSFFRSTLSGAALRRLGCACAQWNCLVEGHASISYRLLFANFSSFKIKIFRASSISNFWIFFSCIIIYIWWHSIWNTCIYIYFFLISTRDVNPWNKLEILISYEYSDRRWLNCKVCIGRSEFKPLEF